MAIETDNKTNSNVTNDNNVITNDNNVTAGGEKTFSQAELDAIVSDRLKRDRAKYADYEELKRKAAEFDKLDEANKSELDKMREKATSLETELNAIKQEREIAEIRDRVAKEKGVPDDCRIFITGTTEEECAVQATQIMERIVPKSYPNIKDGGEVNNVNKPSNEELFKEWLSKQ